MPTKSYRLRALTTYNGSEEAIEQLEAATTELNEVKETLAGIITGTAEYVLNQDDNRTVRDGTYDGCINLVEYSNINGSLVNIGENAFRNCISLTTIPYCMFNASSSLGARAFQNCSSLPTLTGEYSTAIIFHLNVPEYCFDGCSSLAKDINCSSNCDYVGERAFRNSAITTVMVSNSVSIYPYAFEGCSGLTLLNVYTRGVDVKIYDGAFKNCTNLTNITQLDRASISYIGSNAFQNCTGLTSITFANGITIDPEAFNGCTNLTGFNFNGTVEQARSSFSNGIGNNVPLTQIICSDGTYVIGS